MKLKVGSLFSGIGGLDLGLEQTGGFEVVWQSEIEPYPCAVLKHHWPDVPNHGDITKIDWSQVEPVDVLCGGFPCQDVSLAGKRAGVKDGTRSGLWSEFKFAISCLRPRYVLIENVPGLISVDAGAGFARVLSDLAEVGYDAEWACVSAADVGAPQKRERVFIVAHTEYPGLPGAALTGGEGVPASERGPGWQSAQHGGEPQGRCGDVEDSDGGGLSGQGVCRQPPRGAEAKRAGETLVNTTGQPQREQDDQGDQGDPEPSRRPEGGIPSGAGSGDEGLADPQGERLQAGREGRTQPPRATTSGYRRIFQPIPRSGFWDDWQLVTPEGELGGAICGGPAGIPPGVDGDTGGADASDWPTPTQRDYKSGRKKKEPEGRVGSAPLSEAVISPWPTPRANDPEKRGNIANDPRNGLPAAAQHHPVPWRTPQADERGQLNSDYADRRADNGQPISLGMDAIRSKQPARLIPPGIPLLETGRKGRVAKLKALGNACTPQQAEYVAWCILLHARGQQ